MVVKIFLDLEDTIITSWGENNLINVTAIREWIGRMIEDDEVHISIFSFAIWNDEDKASFERDLKGPIERALDVTIDEWLSTVDMQRIVEEWCGMKFLDHTDFIQMNGKHGAFEKVCLAREKECTCILVDDAIPHRTIEDHTRGLTIELMPVQLIADQPLRQVQLRL